MKHLYITILLLASLFLNACRKDTDVFVPDPGQLAGPDTTWYTAVTASMPVNELQTSLFLSPDIDSVTINNNPDTILSASGLQCIFPPNSCTDSTGSLVTGSVSMKSFLLKRRGDFIRMGLPTVANGNLLVSGGAFSVQLQKGNTALQLAKDSSLNISYSDTNIAPQLNLFNGITTQNSQAFNWLPDTTTSNNIISGNAGYVIKSNQLHWVNCSYFYGDTSSNNKTSVAIKLPSNFTNANTLAYIVVSNMRSVMPLNGDVTLKQFVATKISTGLDLTIVTISKDGNFYYLGQQTITTVIPSSYPISITPVRVSLDAIKTYLDSL